MKLCLDFIFIILFITTCKCKFSKNADKTRPNSMYRIRTITLKTQIKFLQLGPFSKKLHFFKETRTTM